MPQPFNQVSDKYTMYLPQGKHMQTYSHFQKSGIDTFTSANATNPDGFLQLDNLLPAINGGFQSRWGTTSLGYLLNNSGGSQFTNALVRMFPYQVSAEGAISGDYYSGFSNYYSIIGTDNTSVEAIFNEGTNDKQVIATFSGTGNVYAATSRSFFYLFDGVGVPQKKHVAFLTDTTSAVGFPAPTPATPGINPNVIANAGTGIGYNLGTTSAVVTSGTGSGAAILLNGASGTQGYINQAIVTSPGSGYLSTDTITVTDTSGGGHGAILTPTFYNGTLVAVSINGPITLNVGRSYALAFMNSKTGHVSDVTTETGVFSYFPAVGTTWVDSNGDVQTTLPLGCTQLICRVSIFPPTDPQIDTVLMVATSDGGDLEHLYEVTTFPLSSFVTDPTFSGKVYLPTNYIDTLPDTINDFGQTQSYTGATLLTNNLYVDVDTYGNIIGIFANLPPGVAYNKPVCNQGRMYTTDGKSVFYSKNITEVTTSTGLITSKWEEAWPGDNVLNIGFDNEVITGLLSDGTYLYIGTTQNIYQLSGTNLATFSIQCIFPKIGVYGQDAWSIVYKEYVPVGYMWVTPDLKVMLSDFTSYKDIGSPIYPLLEDDNGFYLQPCTFGPYNMAMLRSGSDPLFVFNLNSDSWYRWIFPQGGTSRIGPILNYNNSAGINNVYFNLPFTTSPRNNGFGFFDPTVYADSYPIPGGLPIAWAVRTGWQDMGDMTGIKVINQIEIWSTSSSLQTSVFTKTSGSNDTIVTNSRTPVAAPTSAMSGLYKAYYATSNTGGKLFSFLLQGTGPITPVDGLTTVLDQFVVEFFPYGRF